MLVAAVATPLLVFAQIAPAPTCIALSRTLSYGSRGPDVVQLQKFLISQSLLASGNATGYFGKLTEAALKSWQKKKGIVSSGTRPTTGYGAVGPKTRAAITKACSASPATSSSATSGATSQYAQGG